MKRHYFSLIRKSQHKRSSAPNHVKQMGGGARYPYPKHVWTPSGGWWTRPANWKMNTAIVATAMGLLTYTVWNYSAEREWRYIEPSKPIPSQRWAKQYRDSSTS